MLFARGCISLANYSITYEETQSNRVSDFRDFVCSLFLKAILFDFYFLLGGGECSFLLKSIHLYKLYHITILNYDEGIIGIRLEPRF